MKTFKRIFRNAGVILLKVLGLKNPTPALLSPPAGGILSSQHTPGEAEQPYTDGVTNGHRFQNSWKPIVILIFAIVVLIGSITRFPMLEEHSRFWDLLEFILGGYVAGNSIESIYNKVGRK